MNKDIYNKRKIFEFNFFFFFTFKLDKKYIINIILNMIINKNNLYNNI